MVLLLLACHAPSEGESLPDSPTAEGPSCTDLQGPGALTEEASARGLNLPQGDPEDRLPGFGGIMVEDLEGDGDLDLVTAPGEGLPLLWINDGKGSFSAGPSLFNILGDGHGGVNGATLADLDGDNLPEILVYSRGVVYAYPNLGGLVFGDGAFLYLDASGAASSMMTLTVADLDLDQDLDLVLPPMPDVPGEVAGPALVLLQDPPGQWSITHQLRLGDEGLAVQASLATDRDGDGDLDILLVNDLSSRTSFWRNDGLRDGLLSLVEDAPRLKMDVEMAGMGMDGADLNDDGLPDWCFSDSGPLRCFMSNHGEWFDGAQALGLVPEDWVSQWGTIGWSVELVDIDNDVDLDVVQAAGELFLEQSAGQVYSDLIWERDGEVYVDRTAELEFGDLYNSVGLASADFDGDGAVELVLGHPRTPPDYYQNHCTQNAWIEVDPVGIGLNVGSIGARVVIDAGGRRQTREIYSLRSHGQGPTLLHFGLGETEVVDRVTVTWPGGGEVVIDDVPARQRLVVQHP